MTVNVTTTAVDVENDVLTYNYTVSQGRIVGTGANVSWDLTGVAPGTYTITAGVDDGCGVCGQTKTQTVTVAACDCVQPPPPPCNCPDVSITGPGSTTQPGQTMTFTANVSGASTGTVTYNWSVSAGSIVSGQGTPTITVQTTADMAGQNITATVNIANDCTTCTKTATETGVIAQPPSAVKVDEFGAATADDIKARLDAFYIELNNNPSDQGVIIDYGTDKQIAQREAQIRKAIAFRKYDASRVTFVRGQGTEVRTVFWRVPSGAAQPTP
jgi:hypothetical protein